MVFNSSKDVFSGLRKYRIKYAEKNAWSQMGLCMIFFSVPYYRNNELVTNEPNLFQLSDYQISDFLKTRVFQALLFSESRSGPS
jgi:hypothetical protein